MASRFNGDQRIIGVHWNAENEVSEENKPFSATPPKRELHAVIARPLAHTPHYCGGGGIRDELRETERRKERGGRDKEEERQETEAEVREKTEKRGWKTDVGWKQRHTVMTRYVTVYLSRIALISFYLVNYLIKCEL